VVIAVFLLLPLYALSATVVLQDRINGSLTVDYHFAYRDAAESIVRGDSPYPAIDDPIFDQGHLAYVYPPLTALIAVPTLLLPPTPAEVLVLVLLALCAAAIPVVLGVRDWRVIGAFLGWAPTASAFANANISLPLALAVALLWRARDLRAAPVWGAAALAPKLFLWPLLPWLVATRRARAALLSVGLAGAVTLVSWAAIGFDGLREFPSLVREATRVQEDDSYALAALLGDAGVPDWAATGASLAVALAALALCVMAGRRGDDRRSFTLAIVTTLLAAPIVWLHYLVFLAVPLAIARPRLSPVWLAPVALWFTPSDNGAWWQTVLAFIVAGAVVTAALRPDWRLRVDRASPRRSAYGRSIRQTTP
jgi:hypothetical protein